MNTDNTELQIDEEKLYPLYKPWEKPSRHREGANIVEGRRGSRLIVPHRIREQVSAWRAEEYAGVSETSRQLLVHWFGGEHRINEQPFRYYFCQQEAIETLIYLYEVLRIHKVSDLLNKYQKNLLLPIDIDPAVGIDPAEDAWAKYAFKLATGTGKTKCMSLAVVWSYFHAMREPDSTLTTRFLVIAPGLTVYERLLDDFGDGKIFRDDPLIPPAWEKDWHLNVVLGNEPAGAGTGVLYLTNIQKLYPKRQRTAELYRDFVGPTVKPSKSIDIQEVLRERISQEQRLMVLNDEAHHVWHPDLAWSKAITFFHETCRERHGTGLVAQLDFSATPKDQKGDYFNHIICDTPLGEAVDAGIVKVPIIGKDKEGDLEPAPAIDAAQKYRQHLEFGYNLWAQSIESWEEMLEKLPADRQEKVPPQPVLFVMCEDTQSADNIANALDTDPFFEKLNGRTLNLHTNLKLKRNKHGEFVTDETKINDADMKILRTLSRSLDSNTNPYACIVSVLMLREGWDVKSVNTIIALRPFTAGSEILPEQTLGRGLRRIAPAGSDDVPFERVAVLDHPKFASLYKEALGREGLSPIIKPISDIQSYTVYIYPDPEKNSGDLEIEFPQITDAYQEDPFALEAISKEDVKAKCEGMEKLKLSEVSTTIEYTGEHMLTGEIVEQMTMIRTLLQNGMTAITYFIKQLEYTLKLKSLLFPTIAPLLEYFITELLFDEIVGLNDPRLIQRLSDQDVAQRIQDVFTPLIADNIIQTETREIQDDTLIQLSDWIPYQFTATTRRPAIKAKRTLFNLVPCHSLFEAAFARWLDNATDVTAFAKNQGHEALNIDYLDTMGRLCRYIPDFFVRLESGDYLLVETKGYPDGNAEEKAKAAIAWCQSASQVGIGWKYLFVKQQTWKSFAGNSIADLIATIQQNLFTEGENNI